MGQLRLSLETQASPFRAKGHRHEFETRSVPCLARRYPRSFAFYLADPTSSVHEFTLIEASRMKFVKIRAIRVSFVGLLSRKPVMDVSSVSPHRVTQLLERWSHGEDAALAELTPLVYEELRRIAHRHMGGQRPDHTLQTTALVNEAYLRLADQTNPSWQNRAHFFAVAARAMRQIVVDYARSQRSQKRGGGALKVELDEAAIVSPEQSKEIVELHEALEDWPRSLKKSSSSRAQIFRRAELRRDGRSAEDFTHNGEA